MRWVVKGVILVEVIAVFEGFKIWRKMNSSQEYRKHMRDNYPTILEGFYKVADFSNNGYVRDYDADQWKTEDES